MNALSRLLLHPLASAGAYALTIVIFLAIAWSALFDLNERRLTLAATAGMLAQLEQRSLSPAAAPVTDGDTVPAGSAFLEGETVTVAGAALLQRLVGVVTRVGGNVVSSQVELQGEQYKNGRVGVIMSCEVDEPRLQDVLYNLEAGMPFLFIDQLVAQPVAAPRDGENNKIRLLLAVTGQWRGAP